MGQTALMLAAGWGLTELVRALIDKGAKVNQLSHSGNYLHQGCESALYFAAQWDHCETVKLLLDSGANPNLENAASALSAAVRFHQRCSVSALLDAGAIVDDKDKQEAKEEGFTEMLKMLEAAR